MKVGGIEIEKKNVIQLKNLPQLKETVLKIVRFLF